VFNIYFICMPLEKKKKHKKIKSILIAVGMGNSLFRQREPRGVYVCMNETERTH